MTNNDADSEPLLMIGGRAVSRKLLEARAAARCRVEECQSYCCSGGVYIHTRQVDDILAHQAQIIPQLPPERQDPALWFDNIVIPDEDYPEGGPCMGTNTVPDATHPAGRTCVFLVAGRRCALQAAGLAAGEHPWRFKPFYCALHPLEIVDGALQLADDNEIYMEGGSCQRPHPDGVIPLYQLFDVETQLVLGADGYAQLAALAQGQGQ